MVFKFLYFLNFLSLFVLVRLYTNKPIVIEYAFGDETVVFEGEYKNLYIIFDLMEIGDYSKPVYEANLRIITKENINPSKIFGKVINENVRSYSYEQLEELTFEYNSKVTTEKEIDSKSNNVYYTTHKEMNRGDLYIVQKVPLDSSNKNHEFFVGLTMIKKGFPDEDKEEDKEKDSNIVNAAIFSGIGLLLIGLIICFSFPCCPIYIYLCTNRKQRQLEKETEDTAFNEPKQPFFQNKEPIYPSINAQV